MNKLLLLSLLCLFSLIAKAQINLVPNPSFEIHDTCPDDLTQISRANGWFPPTGGTSDYFNACAPNVLNGVGVPENVAGKQNARMGLAYAGVGGYVKNGGNYREYIEIQLSDTLKANEEYCVSFYVSLADSMSYAINSFGAYFSKTRIEDTSFVTLSYTPQVSNPANRFLSSYTDWMEISGSFIASGGENYVIIGIFTDEDNTDTLRLKNDIYHNPIFYYYIDQVSTILCNSIDTTPMVENKIFIPNAFTPNGDGANDILYVRAKGIQLKRFVVFNRWGELIFETSDIDQGWDGSYKGETLDPGVFVYYLEAINIKDGSPITKKGNITLIR